MNTPKNTLMDTKQHLMASLIDKAMSLLSHWKHPTSHTSHPTLKEGMQLSTGLLGNTAIYLDGMHYLANICLIVTPWERITQQQANVRVEIGARTPADAGGPTGATT